MKPIRDWNLTRNPSSRMKPNRCPWCDALHDAAWNDMAHKPKPEDLALCCDCGEWMQFGPKLELIKPDDEGYMAIINDKTATDYRRAWLATEAGRKHEGKS